MVKDLESLKHLYFSDFDLKRAIEIEIKEVVGKIEHNSDGLKGSKKLLDELKDIVFHYEFALALIMAKSKQ